MKTTIDAKCIHCGTVVQISVNKPDYEAWKGGKLIQDALPYLTPVESELLVSKTCETCWDKMFEGFDDEDDDDEDLDEDDYMEEHKQYREEREQMYQDIKPTGKETVVKEYRDFTEDERLTHQLIWEHHLHPFCADVEDGKPCDLGMPCDKCHYDRELKLQNIRDAKRLGLPITPKDNELFMEQEENI